MRLSENLVLYPEPGVVGPAGFEPATPRSLKRLYQPCAPWRCLAYNLTRLSHGPTFFARGTLTRIKTFQILVCFSKVLRPRQVRRVSWSLGPVVQPGMPGPLRVLG